MERPEAQETRLKNQKSISIFFPCYNEQDNIERVTEQALGVLQKLGLDFEVIIVNDGSSDNTAAVAEKIARRNNNVKLVNHERNSGYGAALQSGFKAATKELVFFTDGDGQFDIGELPSLLPLMEQYDIVCCYRMNRRDNLIRKINGWCWSRLVCLLFGLNVRDVDCAFKLFKREIFDNIKLSSNGALISTELLARAAGRGYRITEKGVHHYPRKAGKQTGANLKVIFRAFKELFLLRKKIRSGL